MRQTYAESKGGISGVRNESVSHNRLVAKEADQIKSSCGRAEMQLTKNHENNTFEGNVLNGRKLKFGPLARWRCSMAQAENQSLIILRCSVQIKLKPGCYHCALLRVR